MEQKITWYLLAHKHPDKPCQIIAGTHSNETVILDFHPNAQNKSKFTDHAGAVFDSGNITYWTKIPQSPEYKQMVNETKSKENISSATVKDLKGKIDSRLYGVLSRSLKGGPDEPIKDAIEKLYHDDILSWRAVGEKAFFKCLDLFDEYGSDLKRIYEFGVIDELIHIKHLTITELVRDHGYYIEPETEMPLDIPLQQLFGSAPITSGLLNWYLPTHKITLHLSQLYRINDSLSSEKQPGPTV